MSSSVASISISSSATSTSSTPTPPQRYTVKMEHGAELRRVSLPLPASYPSLLAAVQAAWPTAAVAPGALILKFRDDDNELVTISSTVELAEALRLHGGDRVRLVLATAARAPAVAPIVTLAPLACDSGSYYYTSAEESDELSRHYGTVLGDDLLVMLRDSNGEHGDADADLSVLFGTSSPASRPVTVAVAAVPTVAATTATAAALAELACDSGSYSYTSAEEADELSHHFASSSSSVPSGVVLASVVLQPSVVLAAGYAGSSDECDVQLMCGTCACTTTTTAAAGDDLLAMLDDSNGEHGDGDALDAPPHAPVWSSPTVAVATAALHLGIICGGCGATPLRGVRYQCTVCIDFSLCETCESMNRGGHDMAHPLLQLRMPVSGLSSDGAACHVGFACLSCRRTPIVGVRFTCTSCVDFSLCGMCERTHPMHVHALVKHRVPVTARAAAASTSTTTSLSLSPSPVAAELLAAMGIVFSSCDDTALRSAAAAAAAAAASSAASSFLALVSPRQALHTMGYARAASQLPATTATAATLSSRALGASGCAMATARVPVDDMLNALGFTSSWVC